MSRDGALEPTAAEPQQPHRHADRADLLSQTQLCRVLGISASTWIRWRASKLTPEAVVMPSGRLKWRREDIDALAGKPVERPGRRYFAAVHRHGAKGNARVS